MRYAVNIILAAVAGLAVYGAFPEKRHGSELATLG
jgi:hypothetical protein